MTKSGIKMTEIILRSFFIFSSKAVVCNLFNLFSMDISRRGSRVGGSRERTSGWSTGRIWAQKKSQTNHSLYRWHWSQSVPACPRRADHAVRRGPRWKTREVRLHLVFSLLALTLIFFNNPLIHMYLLQAEEHFVGGRSRCVEEIKKGRRESKTFPRRRMCPLSSFLFFLGLLLRYPQVVKTRSCLSLSLSRRGTTRDQRHWRRHVSGWPNIHCPGKKSCSNTKNYM